MKTKIIKKTFLILTFMILGFCFAAIPNTYVANHDIKDDRERIEKTFVEIEANNKIGLETPTSKFGELHNSFSNVFPKFPQDYSFQVVYQQCLQLSNSLSTVYNYDTFVSFMDNCYKPLSQILTRINTHFTIKASSIARPTSGPAPLNVTFDGRTSIDPSNETIPSSNYFWYYRDMNGVDQAIGEGPIINHTFQEAGNYLVHLTVRSSNKNNKGIFDGRQTLSIDVTPKAANINVYANSKKLRTFEKTKFGTQEGEKGIVLDGSATMPIGGRQIIGNTREVTSKDGFRFIKEGEGVPGVIKVIFPKEGEYSVKLKTNDNEGNNISEAYFILISDPVAIIKQTPEKGNTSNTFNFDSSPSYSVVSNLKLFTREIFNNKGDKLETFQGKSIKYQFREPGSYTVKLTVEDELGQKNIDTSQVYVESSDPIAQFNIKASEDRKYPSKFIFDAGLSSDIDVQNGFDELTYDRSFSNPNFTRIVSTKEKNKIIEVSFDSIGEHTVKLSIKDKFGKINEIEKIINIESTLRPEIYVAPKATTRGNAINFIVQTNEEIINYSRDFGDGNKITTQTNRISHTYQKVGVYKVELTVNGSNGMENTISETVFIGEKNSPIAAYKVLNEQQQIIRQNEECVEVVDDTEIIHNAFKVERYQIITVDPRDSVNIKGESSNLSYYFQPRNGEIFKSNQFKHSFNEMGCQFVDFTLEDTSMGINDKIKIRFKVYNSLPILSNLVLLFPQYGNEMGVGFNENYVRDIFNTDFDPLIVKVQAMNAKDSDGFISYFKRYYYYKNDPSRPLETKITPGDIDYAYFSLPKIPGEFMFGVTIYDNDDGKNPSESVIGNGPIVFFPPDTKRPDIPLVTLKTSKTTVEVGDEVIFDVVSKIISDRADFIQERTIMYDFDGDGERDLTTKKDRVSYTYTTPSDIGYTPRAAVLYRGYRGVGIGGNIIVKKGLKPRILFDNAGKFVIFRDISLGDIQKNSTCLSLVDCKRENEGYLIDSKNSPFYHFEYPEYQKYFVSVEIEDKYANQANVRIPLELTGIKLDNGETGNYTGDFKLLSIPQYQENEDGSLEIMVGKSLDNSVVFYVLYDDLENEKDCYVDLDISDKNEKDFYCNQIFFKKFDPKYESTMGKIYYEKGGQLLSKDLRTSFLDFEIQLDEKTKVIYDKTTQLINTLQDENLKGLLINLQKGIIDPIETQSSIIAIQNYLLTQETTSLTDKQKEDVQRIVNELGDSTTISAFGGTEYDIAKAEILGILPSNLKIDVEKLFMEFENSKGNLEEGTSENDQRQTILNNILLLISQKISQNPTEQKEDEVAKDDMDMIIMPNICKISNYFNIPSEKCISDNTKIVDSSDIKAEKGSSTGLKILLIILGSFFGVFIILILVFAIKAKMKKNEEDEEEQ